MDIRKRRLVSKNAAKRIISIMLTLAMLITMVPAVALADDREQCGVCGNYVPDEAICDDCGNCMACHVNDDGEGAWCVNCEQCFYEVGGFCEEYNLCDDCIEELGWHCPNCGDCYCDSDDGELCPECGVCKKCGNSCLICNYCEQDWNHCELCGECLEEVDQCPSGGNHCVECCENNDWLCPECGECTEANDTELCDICGLCLECCEAAACSECGMCAEDTDFDVHFCEECGDCLEVKDVCDDCGLCRECCLALVEATGCTCEDFCWTDLELSEHICDDCGRCFGQVEACESCLLAGIVRCVNCCEEYSRFNGCDCDDYICVNSDEWEKHAEELHSEPTGEHRATLQKTWSMDSTGHWHSCKWCDDKDHESTKYKHTIDSRGRCVVCGYSDSDSIIILSHPKDATSEVSDRFEGTVNTVKFKVNAWSKDGAENLHYRWYGCNEDGSNPDDYLEYFASDDASSSEIIIRVMEDDCYLRNAFYLICKITDDNGNEVWSRPANLVVRHKYKCLGTEYDKNDVTAEYHTLRCVGDECIGLDEMARRQAHTFGDWIYEVEEDGRGKKYKECSVCGYRRVANYHDNHHSNFEGLWNPNTVITVDPEKNDGKYEGYYVDSYGKTVEFGGDTYWHWETCSEDGCTVKVRSKHIYGSFQAIDKMPTTSTAETHGYRECAICAYQDSVLHKYIDANGNEYDRVWKFGTHPVNFTVGDGTSNPYLAYEGETIKIYPKQNGQNRITEIKVSINYKESSTDKFAFVSDISNRLVEIIPGKEYELVVPRSSSRNGVHYYAYPIVVEVYYSDELCEHSGVTSVENAVEPTCVNEGYTGDVVCDDCGAIVTHGTTIPAKGHGEEIKVTESVRAQTRAKLANGKYGYVDKKDNLGRYVYIVQAETIVNCSDPEAIYERGSYTGDYVCADCGEITTKGKYVAKTHSNVKVERAKNLSGTIKGYTWPFYLTVIGAKDFINASMTKEGYSGDQVCRYCGHLTKGRKTELKVKYIDNIVIKGLVAPVAGMTKAEFNEKYPISITKPVNGIYEYSIGWINNTTGESLWDWDEFEKGVEYSPYIDMSTSFGDDDGDGVYEDTYLFLGFGYDVDSRGDSVFVGDYTYEGTVSGINYTSIEAGYVNACDIIITGEPMMADYLVIDNPDITIGNIKPIVGKTPAECTPSFIMSENISSNVRWYRAIYDEDGIEIENQVLVKNTEVFEAGEEYFVFIELETDASHKFDITAIDKWNNQYNGKITFPDISYKADVYEQYIAIESKVIKAMTPKFVKGVSATCTKTGIMDHYELNGRFYSDSACTKEVTDLVTKMTSHNFVNKECTVCHVKECAVTGNHSFTKYNTLGADKHQLVCATCKTVKTTEAHKYINDKCVCGQIKISKTTDVTSVTNSWYGVTVKWNAVTGYSYNLYRKPKAGSTWTKVVSTTATSYYDKTAVNNTEYTYAVRLVKSGSEGANGKTMDIRFMAPPTISSVDNVSNGVTINWSAVSGASGYYVYRKDTQAGTWHFIGSATKTTFTDTKDLTPGTSYYYAIKSFYKDPATSVITNSASSSAKNTVYVKYTYVSALTNPAAGQLKVDYVKSDKATGYEIAYCPYSTFGPNTTKTVTVTDVNTLNKTIAGLNKGTTYYVKVRAYKTVGSYTFYSSWSASKNLKLTK